METVNKYVTAASTVIWGENESPKAQQHGEEPMSGVQGQGRATDPYDGGNRDEQPGAIKSDVSTAPMNPILDNKQSKPRETEVTSITTPHAPTSITACTSVTPALSMSGEPTESSRINDNNSKQEQRSTLQAEDGESSEAARSARQDVSKEALEGPQGPAPKSAEAFEKESKGNKSVAKDDDIEKSLSTGSKDSGKSIESPLSSNKSEHSSLDSEKAGKQGTISKVKESVKKHLHHSGK
ncbi:hypothetical protein N7463_009052 [Penicillium fimorum]|uniref:Uncharacterized protein n=1 Tax=Penicillium fimorum TaxID=1882269 RepID=A0A9X0C4B7_9EURO|nr:hypothetical protein N7463_009052 [Penicillium fimorum]